MMDSLEHCVDSYDLKHILLIRELPDALDIDPLVKFDPSTHYSLEDFAKTSLHIVLKHQVDTNLN